MSWLIERARELNIRVGPYREYYDRMIAARSGNGVA